MVTTADLRSLLDASPSGDRQSRERTNTRIGEILRPPGALTRLDELALWLSEWQHTDGPTVDKPVAFIFAADHGVARESVSAYPADVTAAMLAAFRASKASVSAMAAVAGASVTAVDVGVGHPTGNIRIEDALTAERFDAAFERGRSVVRGADADLLILGEMGIGNTTPAAAVCAALLGGDVTRFIGRGTGIDDDGLARKMTVVSDALHRIDGCDDPLEVLRRVGGSELVAIAGALVESRVRSIPVLLDGYIATSPALALHHIDPALIAHCRAGHCSAEPGHRVVLGHLGLAPLLTLDMRLGEGSGAMAALPLAKMACALVNNVPTFGEWFGADA